MLSMCTSRVRLLTLSSRRAVLSRTEINHRASRAASHIPLSRQSLFSSPSGTDEKIARITEMYATAQDEFEIALEETTRASEHAAADRKAARNELDKVQAALRAVNDMEDPGLAFEVQRRLGQRVRDLEVGVEKMEEMAGEMD